MTVYHEWPEGTLYQGDCREVLRGLPDCSVDTIITDPPYDLTANKQGGSGEASLNVDSPAGRARVTTGGGFMGQAWDATGVAFDPATWAEVLRVAKPGAFLLAFGGTRTSHRMACAIDDAGWEIRDTIQWVYATGFPKSLDLSKAMDKAAGAEREVVGSRVIGGVSRASFEGGDPRGQIAVTVPATDTAVLWSGWGTALKPAHEPIIVAMKPLEGTFAGNAEKWGVAGLHVEAGRVLTGKQPGARGTFPGDARSANSYQMAQTPGHERTNYRPHTSGRYPPNLVFSHAAGCRCVGEERVRGSGQDGERGTGGIWSGETNKPCGPQYADADGLETVAKWECVDGCPVKALGEQNSNGVSSVGCQVSRAGHPTPDTRHAVPQTDRGTAARFFPQFPGEDEPPFLYTAKSSRAERERGLLGHLPCAVCGSLDSEWHLRLPSGEAMPIAEHLAPQLRDALREDKHLCPGAYVGACFRNAHPTIKPVALMEWLCRLTETPTGGVVLDPFAGSGSTLVACVRARRRFVGIEQDGHYCEIARWRLEAGRRETAQGVLFE